MTGSSGACSLCVRSRCRGSCSIAVSGAASGQQPSRSQPGMVIDHSMTIRPGRVSSRRVRRSRDTGDHDPRHEHHGRLQRRDARWGSLARPIPTRSRALGSSIDGGSHVTIKNAVVRGYKVGILARRSPDLHLTAQRRLLQLEAAALQRHREGESRRLDVVSPEREGRVAALRRRRSTCVECDAPRSTTTPPFRGRTD